MMSTQLNAQLAAHVSAGASLTLPDGLTLALADAMILNDGRLWYCEIWPRDDFAQHWLECRTIDYSIRSNQIRLTLEKRAPAVMAPLDGYQRIEWNWHAWTQDKGMRAYVEQLRKMALITPRYDA